MSNPNGKIRYSTDADMEEIYAWLKIQNIRKVEGTFYCNWELTKNAHDRGDLVVFVDGKSNEIVAYQWGGISGIDIMEVRVDKRGQGIGTKLVNRRISIARKNKQNILVIECKPKESIPFWEKMGFILAESSSYNQQYAYLTIKKTHQLPTDGQKLDVEVNIYPEEKNWNSSVHPLRTAKPQSVITDDHVIYLEERISIPGRLLCNNKDPVVEIKIDSVNLYCDKAKYPQAQALGVNPCLNGYYIDRIIKTKSN